MFLYHWGLLLEKVTKLGNFRNEGKAVLNNGLEFLLPNIPQRMRKKKAQTFELRFEYSRGC